MRVLITGITGQDGSYLAEHLAAEDHEVWGLLRGQRHPKRAWIEALVPGVRLVEGDLLDQTSLHRALETSKPDVVYNLAAITYVGMSWQQPTLMTEVTGLGCLRMLEAIRAVDPGIRFVQASSSEMFGQVRETPQTEVTPFAPRSPYAVAKAFAHHVTVNYRESYGLHASTAIMFNHESPRRGEEFVTRKVTAAVARIVAGQQNTLALGNLDARRDWGWAPEYMRALPLLAGLDAPDDVVLATGVDNSVRDLCDVAFNAAGLDWADHVRVDPGLYRPADVPLLLGDADKARRLLGWEPAVVFSQVVIRMLKHDMRAETGQSCMAVRAGGMSRG